MTDRKSSPELATIAGRIMADAKKGGPIKAQEEALIAEMAKTGGGTPAVLEVFERILRPFIDDAESLAASVLSQAKK